MTESNGEGLAAMVCDVETGICGPAGDAQDPQGAQGMQDPQGATKLTQFRPAVKKVDMYYVTDPICSHCWALEPALRRFEHEYGRHLDVRVIMGGLLPAWDGFADRKNGIRGPEDVAHHWREVGEAARMPIDGSVWLRDPVTSSYPPSRVYVVLRERDPEVALRFLRLAREAVFAFDRNISDPAVLADVVDQLGHPDLTGSAIVAEADSERGHELLTKDITLAREMGVRGFPTILFVNEDGAGVKVTGVRQPEAYVDALTQTLGEGAEVRTSELPTLSELFEREGRLFSKEIEAFYGVEQADVEAFVREHTAGVRSGMVLGEMYWEAAEVAATTA